MKYVLIITIFMSSSVWAIECSLKKISLYGDVVFFNKINGKVEKEIQYNIFPKVWTVNADRFYKLYIKNESKEELTDVAIHLQSQKIKEFTLDKKFKLATTKNKMGYQEIEGIFFNKDVLPNFAYLPVEMNLKIFSKDRELCEENFKLEVVH